MQKKVNISQGAQTAMIGEIALEEFAVRKLINPIPTAVISASSTPFSNLVLKCEKDFVAIRIIPINIVDITAIWAMFKTSLKKRKPRNIVIGNSSSITTSTTESLPFFKASKLNSAATNVTIPKSNNARMFESERLAMSLNINGNRISMPTIPINARDSTSPIFLVVF